MPRLWLDRPVVDHAQRPADAARPGRPVAFRHLPGRASLPTSTLIGDVLDTLAWIFLIAIIIVGLCSVPPTVKAAEPSATDVTVIPTHRACVSGAPACPFLPTERPTLTLPPTDTAG